MFFVVQIILALTLQATLIAKHNIVKVTLKIVIPLQSELEHQVIVTLY